MFFSIRINGSKKVLWGIKNKALLEAFIFKMLKLTITKIYIRIFHCKVFPTHHTHINHSNKIN